MAHRDPLRRACLAALAALLLAPMARPSLASSAGEQCGNPSGSLTGESGGPLYHDGNDDRPLDYEVVRETVLLERRTVCETAWGRRLTYGRTLTLLDIRYTIPDADTFDGTLLCEFVFDDYPNVAGIDTTCVREFDAVHRRLGEEGLVDLRTDADRAAAAVE